MIVSVYLSSALDAKVSPTDPYANLKLMKSSLQQQSPPIAVEKINGVVKRRGDGSPAPRPSAPAASQPRESLRAVADGRAQLRREDLEALLTGHLLETDERTRKIAERFEFLLEVLFSPSSPDDLDVRAVADLTARFDRLHRGSMGELRRCVELLARLSQPAPPTVKVISSQVNVGAAQQIAAVDLGGRDEKR